jgi:acyl dehydratase
MSAPAEGGAGGDAGPANAAASIEAPWFEDFHVGLEFDAPAVTLTAGFAALHQAMFGDRLRLPLDHHASAAVTGANGPLVHPLLAINVAIGQSTWASQRVKANLFYRGLTLRQQVFTGDTLHTTTRVVALRQNRAQAGRAATGIVALEMLTRNQRDETVLHFWRCPMIPCRDDASVTGHAADLTIVGNPVDAQTAAEAVPGHWSLSPTASWRGLLAQDIAAPLAMQVEARDTVTSAPELVRLTLNLAMAHTDARLSYLGDRLVYGGHVICIAFAQITRALPNLVTLLAWESCDHTAPTLENDRLRTAFTVTRVVPRGDGRGALLRIEAQSFAARGTPEQPEQQVLDWKFWAWSA